MKYLPLFFDVTDKLCLIVGGGIIGTRRARVIAAAGAKIDLVAINPSDEIKKIVVQSGGKLTLRSWQATDIRTEYRIIVAATNNPEVNKEIAAASRKLDISVNVVTDSGLCDFAFPTTIDRDPLTIAVSSGSASPLLARLLGERIDSLIPAGYGKLATLVGKYRQKVKDTLPKPDQRKLFWQKVLNGGVAETIFSGNQDKAEKLLEQTLAHPLELQSSGEVYLIGAGPGDPDLLTFRAFRLLQQSDIVLYDRLVSQKILDQISANAEMVYVGKQRSKHAVPQQAINQQLVTHAMAGNRVARLKGGDPFIFGRGGEEIALLAKHRIPFQVVPGITAASGCASYSGIPLTHRDHAQSVRFVTGQLKDGTVDLPWGQLVAPDQTVVIYMGLNGLPVISEKLIEHGLAPDTPAAMIEQGTTLDQKIHCSTLAKLPGLVDQLSVKPPTLMIIGSVVSLHESLNWYQTNAE